jgi:hypothetical protein
MNYMLFYTGLVSTPFSVGLKCLTTNEIICEISTNRPTGKETRKIFNKYRNLLKQKYSHLEMVTKL